VSDARPFTLDSQVYASETVRDICERCLVNPFEKGFPEVTWANTCLPLSERLEKLEAPKPWQLNLSKGEDVLMMTVPAGVAIRAKPLRSKKAKAESGGGADEKKSPDSVPTFSDAFPKPAAEKRGGRGGAAQTQPRAKARRTGIDESYTGSDADVSTEETEPRTGDSGEDALERTRRGASSDDRSAELVAAGLMAVAAGTAVSSKRGPGRPKRNPEGPHPTVSKKSAHAMRDGSVPATRGAFEGTAGASGAVSVTPALLAAYEAGRADATAAAMRTASAAAGFVASASMRVLAARAPRPSVADIIDKFYTHRPSSTAEDARPLRSFRTKLGEKAGEKAAARTAVAAAAATPESFNAGSAANNRAAWEWNKQLAALSSQAGDLPGAFLADLSSPYASLFAPPSTAEELRSVRDANARAILEVSSAVEEVRLASAAVGAEGGDALESAATRARFVAKVERVLRGVDAKKFEIPVSQRAAVAESVSELRKWVKTQLQARVRELSTRAWEARVENEPNVPADANAKGKAPAYLPRSDVSASESSGDDAPRTSGFRSKSVSKETKETCPFSLLATVAAASENDGFTHTFSSSEGGGDI